MTCRLGLLAVALASGSGCCAPVCSMPDGSTTPVYGCEFARLVHHVCTYGELPDCGYGIGCGCSVGCGNPVDYGCCPAPQCESEPRPPCIEPGPPPECYQPPMPPKFLQVPTRSVFSNVNVLAPTSTRGAVEVGFGPELAVPGRD